MKRYELYVWDNPDGTVHADIKEDIDGRYVLARDAEASAQAAVAAEQKRVWDVINARISVLQSDVLAWDEKVELEDLLDLLFPDGEPKEIDPPAGERLDDEI